MSFTVKPYTVLVSFSTIFLTLLAQCGLPVFADPRENWTTVKEQTDQDPVKFSVPHRFVIDSQHRLVLPISRTNGSFTAHVYSTASPDRCAQRPRTLAYLLSIDTGQGIEFPSNKSYYASLTRTFFHINHSSRIQTHDQGETSVGDTLSHRFQTNASLHPQNSCGASEGVGYFVRIGSRYLFAVLSDKGSPQSTSTQDIEKIVRSIRA